MFLGHHSEAELLGTDEVVVKEAALRGGFTELLPYTAQKLDRPHSRKQTPRLVDSAEIAQDNIEELDHTQLV